jgi:mRNA-degrading endonuclease RelE of RelBE toxin-antitoxin system
MAIIMVSMSGQQPFSVVYDPVVREHLRAVDAKYHSLIRTTIEQQLLSRPDVETRNRKPLKRPVAFEAGWELRFGPQNRFRIFYDVDPAGREVHILAIGVKVGNRLTIGTEEVEL